MSLLHLTLAFLHDVLGKCVALLTGGMVITSSELWTFPTYPVIIRYLSLVLPENDQQPQDLLFKNVFEQKHYH